MQYTPNTPEENEKIFNSIDYRIWLKLSRGEVISQEEQAEWNEYRKKVEKDKASN